MITIHSYVPNDTSSLMTYTINILSNKLPFMAWAVAWSYINIDTSFYSLAA